MGAVVVVGVDGSAEAAEALEYAAGRRASALDHGAPLGV